MTANKLSDMLKDEVFPCRELDTRPVPPTDFVRDKLAIQDLAQLMVSEPEAVLPRFVALAMEITGGSSAGLSLLEDGPDGEVFRWRYLHGSLAAFEDACTPRHHSPCGVTLDRQEPVLSVHAERAYDWISSVDIVVPEVLLVPLQGSGGGPVGTLWIVSEQTGHFHGGHARSMTELASFVGLAVRMVTTEHRLQAALDEQSLLASEMNHRVKNLFAVTDSLIRSTARNTDTNAEMADALSGRLHALASAHSLVSRHLNEVGRAPRVSDLRSLLEAVLSPHDMRGGVSRFNMFGPLVRCGDRAINGIALVFHELATNAVKYGALSALDGRVEVQWAKQAEDVVVTWIETGGPKVRPSAGMGFGGSLIERTVMRQFKGSLDYDWRPGGLRVTIRVPQSQVGN